MMTNNRCDLPKVRLKFKTTASDISNQFNEIPRIFKCNAAPSIFPERHKMSKEMHDAFMRYRNLKKHNYIREIAYHKKNISLTECKKMDSTNTNNKTTFHRKLDIALESSFAKGFQDLNSESLHRSKLNSLKSKNKQSKEVLWSNNESSKLKSQTVSIKPKKAHDNSQNMHDKGKNVQEDGLQLEGFRCQYETSDERKQRAVKFRRSKKKLKATRGSSSFLIQAWKQDKIYRGASYYLKNHSDPFQL